ncbi:104_t:CDS:2 [Gigaspora margarita]|uniref:104_t:CDS:1 n=1 Tax=Gigaspora margarita TaxID=4874 RepID=A0ABN7WH57_GIGMA|nr:104_t:CDS:2 [Gigaspora margarita]
MWSIHPDSIRSDNLYLAQQQLSNSYDDIQVTEKGTRGPITKEGTREPSKKQNVLEDSKSKPQEQTKLKKKLEQPWKKATL